MSNLYEAAERRFLEIKKEWDGLGFWARFRRSREFAVRFDFIINILKHEKAKNDFKKTPQTI